MHIKVINGAPVPYSWRDIERDQPAIKDPRGLDDAALAALGVFVVAVPAAPESPLGSFVDADGYELIDGGWVQRWVIKPVPGWAVALSDVTAERNRRAAGGFVFPSGGDVWRFDSDSEALKRITGAATLAGFAVAAGAVAGDYLWHGGADPFSWILSDNQIVQIDALTMFAVGQLAASWESQHIFAARTIKDLPEIPLDFADNSYWP